MKKLMMTAAVLACAASIVSAQSVTSANIVGYAKPKTIPAGSFEILVPQFSGKDGGTTLDNAFADLNENSVVYVWTGTGYEEYTWYGPVNGWYSKTFIPSGDVVLSEGTAVWLKDGSSGAAPIMSGEVPSAASITNTVAAGFNLVANPYPVATTLDSISGAGGIAENDVIYVWTGMGYEEYTYYGLANGWYSKTFVPSGSVAVPVGVGFWLSSGAGGDIIFTKNF